MDAWLVIGISGVTCGGKSTLAKRLVEYFQDAHGQIIKENMKINKVCLLQQDTYFWPKDSAQHTHLEKLENVNNREILSAVNMDKMCKDTLEVLGEKFLLYNTSSDGDVRMDEDENLFADHHINFNLAQKKYQRLNTFPFINLNILILDGFLIFNHPFTMDLCNLKFHMHVPYEVCYNRRKERRRLRLGAPDHVGYFEMIVWPMYEKHFNEFKDHEGVVFLNGVLPVEQISKFVVKSIENAL
jgi:nicotinamide/nicotinate riboside kinase